MPISSITATTSEINALDGLTSTVAELNILDTVTATAAELNYLDIASLGTGAASKAVVLDGSSNFTFPGAGTITIPSGCTLTSATGTRNTANVGTANTGVTAVEYGDGYNHVSVLTVSQTDALTTADNAAISDGYLLYTFPAGACVVDYAYMSMAMTSASTEQQSDTPDVGLGTVIGSGANATLNAVGATSENIITGQTAADANGTATVKTALPTAGTPFVIESADAHTVYFNVADTWADDTGADLTADISGTVVLVWRFMA